jgi:hypothetical protein
MTFFDLIAKRRLLADAPAATLALLATALLLDPTKDETRATIIVSLAVSWLAVVATSIFASAHGWTLSGNLFTQLVVGALAAAVPWAPAQASLFHPTFFVGLAFASLAAPLGRLKQAETYWPWVEKLCFAAALATLGAVVGFAATVATLLSAATLFGIDGLTFGPIAPKVASVMFGAVAPIAFLALRPAVVESTLNERETDFVRRAASALACYALAPFVLVYSALLWAYAGKIALERSLPMGQIGMMVGAFGVTAILTILLIFPERSRGPFTARWLWRIWPFLLPAPLVLLGFAIVERIDAYGLTPDRYVASALALLCAASGVAALGDRDRVIRFTPAATALVLLLVSFGPFGAVESSLHWQSAAVRSILSAHGLLGPDGHLVEDGPRAALTPAETRRWRAAIALLRQFERAPPAFSPEPPKAADALARLDARIFAAKVRDGAARARWRFFDSQSWAASAGDGLDDVSIVGAVMLPAQSSASLEALRATLDGLHLVAELPSHVAVTFDLAALARRLDENASPLPPLQIVEAQAADDDGFRLFVQRLSVSIKDQERKVETLTALVLKRAAPPPAPEHSR